MYFATILAYFKISFRGLILQTKANKIHFHQTFSNLLYFLKFLSFTVLFHILNKVTL